MSVVITRSPRRKGEAVKPPVRDGSGPYDFAMVYAQGTKIAWTDGDITELVSILVGNPDYPTLAPQQALVERIKAAIRIQCIIQAIWNAHAMANGDWEQCTPTEREVLNSRRDRQPRGWSTDLLGHDYWTAPVPLVLVTTGWHGEEHLMPTGPDGAVCWIDPLTDEDLLVTLEDLGFIEVWCPIS